MTFAETKTRLSQLLADSDNSVISLSGKWGTGKTHLLDQLIESDEFAADSITVSLFGLSSLEQMKMSLLQASTPLKKVDEGVGEGLKLFAKAGWDAATDHFKPLAALNDVKLVMMVPALLKNKLVIIDDIERKSASFGMDELLGFVDEYSKKRNTRFILVLNDDQLKGSHKEDWQTLNEKVVDRSLRLVTSPEEAFDIATLKYSTAYGLALRAAVAICGLTNVRIIQQVIKITNSILQARTLDPAVVARVVPSIVLFSAIHYRGLNDGPDKQFALEVGRIDWEAYEREKAGRLTDEDKRAKRWKSMMQELGIRSCDEFEFVLVDFLESGLFEPTKINEIIERYKGEHQALLLRESISKFHLNALWNHHASDAQLLADAEEFIEFSEILDPYTASQLCTTMSNITGGESAASRLRTAWIGALPARISQGEVFQERHLAGPLDPQIEMAISATENSTEPPTADSLVMAVLEVKKGAWGTKETTAIRNARASDFDVAIRTLDGEALRSFMYQMTQIYDNRSSYKLFGDAPDCFIEACRNIARDQTSARLKELMPIWVPQSVSS